MKRRFPEKFPRLSNRPKGVWTFFHKAVSCSFVLLFNFYLSDMLFIRQAADTALRIEGFPRPRPKDTAQTCPNDRKDFIPSQEKSLWAGIPLRALMLFLRRFPRGISTMKNLQPRSVSPELLRKIAPAPGFSRKQGDAWLPYPAGDAMEIPLFSQGPLIKRGRKGIYM